MKINYSYWESNSGGRLNYTKNGIVLTGSIWTMFYTRLFGGNDQSTDENIQEGEERFDYWGNSIGRLKNRKELQFNSRLPALLKRIALISGNLTQIERTATEDLRFIQDIINIEVEASIPKRNTLKLLIKAQDAKNKQNLQAQFIIDETNTEEIIQAPVEVPTQSDGGVLFLDSTPANFLDNTPANFLDQ
jgi:phage gp46-like protein